MSRFVRIILLFFLRWLIVFPMVVLNWIFEVLSGQYRWVKDQQKRMSEERRPMTDLEFLEHLRLPDGQADVALAVRHAFAHHSGLPKTAVYPDDQVEVYLRMMSPWASELDIIFDVEYHQKIKIPFGLFSKARAKQQKELIIQFVSTVAAVAE